jgi:cellulose synthase/poly-beta-1,6-N-acetylglucosamine synthase-like glycosyltransferase
LRAARAAGVATLVTVAAFGHVLYPVWLWATTRGRPAPEPPQPDAWPPISVLVVAHREAGIIGDKVKDVYANRYPGPFEVLVVADDPETANAARGGPARVIEFHERLGKPGAINRGVEAASYDLVVITDANARLAPGSLAALVRWVGEDGILAVAGRKTMVGSRGENLYWWFESWLKQLESRTGSTIGLVGELAAFDRSRFRALPADTPIDDLWLALDFAEQGGRIVYEPRAVTEETELASPAADWDRRTRIVAGTLEVLWRRRRLLVPGATLVTAQLWGHRLVRSSVGPVAHALLLVLAATKMNRSRTAALFVGVHALGTAAVLRRNVGRGQSTVERAVAQILYLQAVGAVGTYRFFRGDRPVQWAKISR